MILTISPSSLNDAIECPTKYNYRKIHKLSALDGKTDAMERGSLTHMILEVHYKLLKENTKYSDIVLAASEFARMQYREGLFSDFDMVEACVKTYQEYAVFYAADAWIPKAIETPFTKLLYEDDKHKIVIEGVIDLIVEISGMLIPVDHKTSDKKDLNPSRLSNQFMAYAWATETNTIIKNDIGFQKTLPPADKFRRHSLSYDPSNITEWAEQTTIQCLKLINSIENDSFEMRYPSCWRCSYKKICESTPDVREYKMSTQYKIADEYDIYGRK